MVEIQGQRICGACKEQTVHQLQHPCRACPLAVLALRLGDALLALCLLLVAIRSQELLAWLTLTPGMARALVATSLSSADWVYFGLGLLALLSAVALRRGSRWVLPLHGVLLAGTAVRGATVLWDQPDLAVGLVVAAALPLTFCWDGDVRQYLRGEVQA